MIKVSTYLVHIFECVSENYGDIIILQKSYLFFLDMYYVGTFGNCALQTNKQKTQAKVAVSCALNLDQEDVTRSTANNHAAHIVFAT